MSEVYRVLIDLIFRIPESRVRTLFSGGLVEEIRYTHGLDYCEMTVAVRASNVAEAYRRTADFVTSVSDGAGVSVDIVGAEVTGPDETLVVD